MQVGFHLIVISFDMLWIELLACISTYTWPLLPAPYGGGISGALAEAPLSLSLLPAPLVAPPAVFMYG